MSLHHFDNQKPHHTMLNSMRELYDQYTHNTNTKGTVSIHIAQCFISSHSKGESLHQKGKNSSRNHYWSLSLSSTEKPPLFLEEISAFFVCVLVPNFSLQAEFNGMRLGGFGYHTNENVGFRWAPL